MKWLAVISLCLSCCVSAHSLSTAFMQLQNTDAGLSATLELSIVDLQQALNWPADQDVRWSDIQKNKTQIISYLQQHLHVKSKQNNSCVLETEANAWTAVEKNQTYYLSLPLFSTCDAHQSSLHYQLFSELHDHKLLVSWQDKQWVVSQQSPQLNLIKVTL
ncbi:hypothetical protein [Rheinheimera sp. 1928-s]|uniref:hypothetical protein n=1 Tax=Rheinheimera sp. 1928-s TaxID=3033803 RepID=UPI00260C208C|nr:hypothetical protein [Rheinheimera sp. 1928-s]MDF3127049.1 hypothetical protein [Rheinheimera sp. 1928-s]